MSTISNHSEDAVADPPQLVVNMADFNDQDLQNFVDISEEIIRTTRERRSQGKCAKSGVNTIAATMTQAGFFESISINDDQFLEALEHETSYNAGRNRADLIRSIENLMQYFDEDVKVRGEESFFECSSAKKSTRGKVATAVASLRSKCALARASPLAKGKSPAKAANSSHIQELKKKYENSVEAEATLSPQAKEATAKSPKLKRKTKVKQLASLFNNINAMLRSTSTTPHKTSARDAPNLDMSSSSNRNSLLKAKSPKMKPKFTTYKTKLPSPKPSPFLRRKLLTRTSSKSSLADTSIQQQELGTASPLAGNIFSQLAVKDKVLLYNKFIADLAQQNPKFSKQAKALESKMKKEIQKGEVVVEKQTPVKQLRDSLEAKLSPNKSLPITLSGEKTSNLKSTLEAAVKSKEYEDISPACSLENDAQDEAKRMKKDVTFAENVTVLEHSLKRTQSMIRSAYCVEPLAPPKKIRRFRQQHLTPKMVFQNSHLEDLFYHWLKHKNVIACDTITGQHKTNETQIATESSSSIQVQKILQAATHNSESSTSETNAEEENLHNGIGVIKQTLESENCRENSVIEIELPTEDAAPEAQSKPTEGSDSGLNSTNKATSEDSQTDLKPDDSTNSNSTSKILRKKKLRRIYPTKDEILLTPKPKVSSTDSDSDYTTKNIKMQSSTLPRTAKSFDKEMIFERSKSSEAKPSSTDQALIRQVNPSSKITTAFTVTVLSSPAAQSKIDYYDAKLASTHVKDISRSCPSLLETHSASNNGFFHDKSVSEELSEFEQPKSLQEQQHLLMENFTDQGFNIATNDSPVRINIKTKNKAAAENFLISYKVKATQQDCWARPALANTESQLPLEEDAPSPVVVLKRTHSPNSINESCCSSQPSITNLGTFNPHNTQQGEMSQFWISSGDFTAAITIHHYPSERLMLLNNIYGQKSWETKELNFGIDDQAFNMLSADSAAEIAKQVRISNNYSQYWFATGNLVIPFKGPQMTNQKIQKFFNYIREFQEETEFLRFGIDSYEFSHFSQKSTNCSAWPVNASSPLKTSDLDQSELDSEEYERSLSFSSLQEIWQKFAANGSAHETLRSTIHVMENMRPVKTTAL